MITCTKHKSHIASLMQDIELTKKAIDTDVAELIQNTFGDMDTKGTSIMLDAVKSNLDEAITKLEQSKALLSVINDELDNA